MPAWLRRLPMIGTFAELQELRARSAVLRDEVNKARAERDRVRKVLTHALPYGTMKDLVTQHAEAYRTADPFPHVVLDEVFEGVGGAVRLRVLRHQVLHGAVGQRVRKDFPDTIALRARLVHFIAEHCG